MLHRLPGLHRFRPRLLDALRGYDGKRLAADIGAGLTVGVVALPLAMALRSPAAPSPRPGSSRPSLRGS